MTRPIIILLLLLSFGCREKVDWDFPEFDPTPTVNSILELGEPISIHVSLAGKFDTVPLRVVDNAVVRLQADGLLLETLNYQGDGIYTSEHPAQYNTEYHCEVDIPAFTTISGGTEIPQPTQILSIEHIDKAGIDSEGLTYPAVIVTFQTNPNEKQYFEVLIWLHEDYDEDEYKYQPELMEITDPVLLNEGLPILLFSNEIIEGDSYSMTINYTTGSAGSSGGSGMQTILYPLSVELRTVCYNYYMFHKQLYLYDTGRYPYIIGGVVTPFPLYSNMEGGYGVFAGYSSVVSGTIYPVGISNDEQGMENNE